MSWMFTRGTLKAHCVKDGAAICGQYVQFFEPTLEGAELEKCKCLKCVKKLALIHSISKAEVEKK